MYDDYTLSLALFDYIPVALSALGLFMIARWIQSPAAVAGAALVTLGGLSKATWKLLVVITGVDHAWMANLLFILLTPGFTLLAISLFARLGGKGEISVWIRSAVILGVTAAVALYLRDDQPDSRAWFFMLLGMTSLATIIFDLRLVGYAMARKKVLAALLVVGNLIGVFTLAYLARLEQTAALQWIEEGINACTHGALTLAIWLLIRGSASLEERRAAEA